MDCNITFQNDIMYFLLVRIRNEIKVNCFLLGYLILCAPIFCLPFHIKCRCTVSFRYNDNGLYMYIFLIFTYDGNFVLLSEWQNRSDTYVNY